MSKYNVTVSLRLRPEGVALVVEAPYGVHTIELSETFARWLAATILRHIDGPVTH